MVTVYIVQRMEMATPYQYGSTVEKELFRIPLSKHKIKYKEGERVSGCFQDRYTLNMRAVNHAILSGIFCTHQQHIYTPVCPLLQ